ncbi:carboxypeptidase-like regulatory domain-containing protein [Sphingobacterium sp. xlx-130]|uniref:carboxypeptidase-like regulatory domain-containing protein n=1 Tax=Sphingobacterium sp. xlx-130 TaxID=2654323 RepID=UPI0013DC6118|nr:carboxypeptidase-like regulatory domain-containing protein [Sphingobacterium sp. xlx-130]
MKTLIIFITFICLSNLTNGQIRVLDSLTLEPISGVNIYFDDGELLAISSSEGQVNINNIQNETRNLSLQHIGYENKGISYGSFKQSDRVLLKPRQVEIEEIGVNNIGNSDYVVLKGYFRTHDTFNSKSRYFYDGLIAYYIPLKNTKEKVRRQLLGYRLYANRSSLAEYTELFGKSFTDPPKLLRIEKESMLENLPKGSVLVNNGSKKKIVQNGQSLGFIQKTSSGNVQIYLDEVPPNSKVARSFFRIKGEQYRGITMANYGPTDLDNLPTQNLLSKIVTKVGAVQRKKKDGFTHIATFSEFYVTERAYLMADEVKALENSFQKSIYLEEKSSYSEKYWLDLDRHGIPPLAIGIDKQLGKDLKEL